MWEWKAARGGNELQFRAGLFKTGLSEPRVKFEFRYQSLNSKISCILFVYSLMTGWPKKNRENNLGKFF